MERTIGAGSSSRRRRDTPEWAWEQALIDAYYDHRWHEVLDPLAAAVRRWEAGELDHVDLARTAGRVRKGVSPIDYVFSQKREMLAPLIEFDEEWSGPWIAAHPRPATGGADAHEGRANDGDQHEAGTPMSDNPISPPAPRDAVL